MNVGFYFVFACISVDFGACPWFDSFKQCSFFVRPCQRYHRLSRWVSVVLLQCIGMYCIASSSLVRVYVCADACLHAHALCMCVCARMHVRACMRMHCARVCVCACARARACIRASVCTYIYIFFLPLFFYQTFRVEYHSASSSFNDVFSSISFNDLFSLSHRRQCRHKTVLFVYTEYIFKRWTHEFNVYIRSQVWWMGQ